MAETTLSNEIPRLDQSLVFLHAPEADLRVNVAHVCTISGMADRLGRRDR